MRKLVGLAGAALLVAAACGSGSKSAPTPGEQTLAPRIASNARVKILQPTAGSTVPAGTVHVKVDLAGATITSQVSTNLKPDLGHLHLMLDGSLVSMNYQPEADIPVSPGSHLIQVEFVALDHGPFNPRVLDSATFTAK